MASYETDVTGEDFLDENVEDYLEDEYSDFIRNSAEMNQMRPEDLDENAESSTAAVSQ